MHRLQVESSTATEVAKSMNREFVLSQAVLAAGVPGMHVPLVGLVDYMGRRVLLRSAVR